MSAGVSSLTSGAPLTMEAPPELVRPSHDSDVSGETVPCPHCRHAVNVPKLVSAELAAARDGWEAAKSVAVVAERKLEAARLRLLTSKGACALEEQRVVALRKVVVNLEAIGADLRSRLRAVCRERTHLETVLVAHGISISTSHAKVSPAASSTEVTAMVPELTEQYRQMDALIALVRSVRSEGSIARKQADFCVTSRPTAVG